MQNEDQIKEIKNQYMAKFDPSEYSSSFYSKLIPEQEFHMKSYYEAFCNEPVLTNRSKSDRSILDFGCGPVPVYVGVAAAANYTDSVTMAEMVPASRKAIESWMKSEKDTFNFDFCFDYLEGLQNDKVQIKKDETYVSVAQRLRSAFKKVLPCDASLENPLDPVCETYDVVMSTLCLEATTTLYDDYTRILGNVLRLLKPGGVVMLAGVYGQNFYILGGDHYPSVKLTIEDIDKALTSHGLKVITTKTVPRENSEYDELCDFAGVYFILAHKI